MIDMNLKEKKILERLKASTDAWNCGDLRGHLEFNDASVTSMTKDGPRTGVAPIEEAFRAAYFNESRTRPALSLEQVVIRFLGDESALMTGRYVLVGDGTPEQAGWFTLVWCLGPGGWMVVHDHSS